MEHLFFDLFLLFSAIILIVLATSKFKVHPALALLIVALLVGLGFGMDAKVVMQSITSGFGGMLGNIGIIIILGCLLGALLEKTHSLASIASGLIRLLGRKKPLTTLSILGIVVGIPVFCDSAYIILSGLSKRMSQQSGTSGVSGAVVMSSSLYVAHNLIPPTPGPLAAAGNLGIADQLGLVIILGLLVSIPVMMAGMFYAKWIARKINLNAEPLEVPPQNSATLVKSILPLLVPIVLIGLGTLMNFIETESYAKQFILFLGHPVVALLSGLLLGIFFHYRNQEIELSKIMEEGISQAGPILIITGMGGAFGSVIKESDLTGNLIQLIPNSANSGVLILVLAFLLSALIKTAQGSSTSAIVIVSALFSTLVGGSLFTSSLAITCLVLAIGAGAMLVSHTNDSYFWIVSRFSNFTMKQTLKTFTIATSIQGITALVVILLIYLVV
jgi:GntP family gluconate:H+ symporter